MRVLFFLLISVATFGQNVGTLPNSVTPIDTSSYTLVAQPAATTLRKLSLNRLHNTMPIATSSISGRLSSTDWTTFNNKLNINGSNANTDIDIGNFNLSAKGFRTTGTGGSGDIHLKFQSADATGTGSSSSLWADANGNLNWKIDGLYKSTFSTSANTANRTYTFPNATGTVALLSDITSSNAGAWSLADGGSLSGANTISGAFNIGFTNTSIGLGVAPSSITANTRAEARGSNDLSTSFAFASTNNSGNILNRTTNNGQFQFGSNASKPFIGASVSNAFDNTGNGLIFQSPSTTIGFTFNLPSMVGNSQNAMRLQGSFTNSSTSPTVLYVTLPTITHTGSGDITGDFLQATLNLNSYSGTFRGFRNQSGFSPSAGTANYRAFVNDHVINTTGTYAGSYIGFDDSPTLTSTTGLSYLSYRGIGGMVLGHTGLTTATTRAQIRGTGTTTDDILLLENSAGTSRFEVQGNGAVLFSGSAGTNGQVLTSAGATSPPTWTTTLTDPMTTRGDIIIRNAANATARLGIGSAGTFLSSDGTDVSWTTPSGSGAYYAPNTLVANATDANFTATINGVHNILDGVATTNRVITIPTGANGDVMKFYNTEDTRVWSFTGASVYLADRVTVVTQLLYNVPCHMEKIDGIWIITN